jgi:peptidoglycan/xylan/chitin deacetylase (PgdA/CDA1 family)
MKLSKKSIIHPFYHIVDDASNALTGNLYYSKNALNFRKDIHYLKKNFKPISFFDFIINPKIKENCFVLSFDDGLSNFYNTVAQILLQEKITAIIFINSNFLNNKNLFFRYKVNILLDYLSSNKLSINQIYDIKKIITVQLEIFLFTANQKNETEIDKIATILGISFFEFLEKNSPYLSSKQITDLVNKGFYFGGHSKSHPYYEIISLEEQVNETIESVESIVSEFNLPYKLFSFPFSDESVTKNFFKIIKNEKIITFGSLGLKDDEIENHYQRIPMEYKSKYTAETIIKGELLYYLLKKMVFKNKILRKN